MACKRCTHGRDADCTMYIAESYLGDVSQPIGTANGICCYYFRQLVKLCLKRRIAFYRFIIATRQTLGCVLLCGLLVFLTSEQSDMQNQEFPEQWSVSRPTLHTIQTFSQEKFVFLYKEIVTISQLRPLTHWSYQRKKRRFVCNLVDKLLFMVVVGFATRKSH